MTHQETKSFEKSVIENALKELDVVKNILVEREQQHGSPDENFQIVAEIWGSYLDEKITPSDVAIMMVLFKVARAKTGSIKEDTLRDLIGYIAIAAGMNKDKQ